MTTEEALSWLVAWIIAFGAAIYYSNKNQTKKWKRPKIKHNKLTKWNWMVSHPERLVLGDNTDIGAFSYIQAVNGVIIENNVQISSHCSIYSKNTIDNTDGLIHIKKGACIGAGSVILPKKDGKALIIGENSKVGALSLVKCDVPANTICFGTPLKMYNYPGSDILL